MNPPRENGFSTQGDLREGISVDFQLAVL